MILDNAIPRLLEAYEKANSEKETQEVKFIYNELQTNDTITSVFDYLYFKGIDFGTRHDEFRFVLLIFSKNKN